MGQPKASGAGQASTKLSAETLSLFAELVAATRALADAAEHCEQAAGQALRTRDENLIEAIAAARGKIEEAERALFSAQIS
jgi:hypothetical protein